MNNRPDRPWPFWYEIRIEYMGLFRARPKLWWRDMFVLPINVLIGRRAEKELFKVIPPDALVEALRRTRDLRDRKVHDA